MSQLLCGAGRHPRAQALPVQIKELRTVHQVGKTSCVEFMPLVFSRNMLTASSHYSFPFIVAKSLDIYSSSPEFPAIYQSDEEQERMMGLYQDLHSHLHHPTRPLRSFYRCSETENLLAWVSLAL